MCLILFAPHYHPDYPLILCANRDEFYTRPTAPLAWWRDAPDILAGRDLKAGGTWMGITRSGRFAALTNFRDPAAARPDAPSRGHLVSAYLAGEQSAQQYLDSLAADAGRYNGFNLLIGNAGELRHFNNRAAAPEVVSPAPPVPPVPPVPPGVHGLSNAFLDTPWPKVTTGITRLRRAIDEGRVAPDALFRIMLDQRPAPDHALPDTGIGLEWERILSPLFISSPTYGTRAVAVLTIHRSGRVRFTEWTCTRRDGRRRIGPCRRFRFALN